MSSSSDKSCSVAHRLNSNFCSTPVVGQYHRLSSINVSTVNTNSSSSTGTKRPRGSQLIHNYTKRKKVQKKLRKRKPVLDRKKKKKKKKVILDSESDWETKLVESNYDNVNAQESANEGIASGCESDALFKTVRSPEQVRRTHHFVDERLDSPIFLRRKEIESPRRFSSESEDVDLPQKDLPPLCVRQDDSDDEEEELCLRKEATGKTYPGLKPTKQRKQGERIEEWKQWLVDVSIPTASSDLLWDNFVKDNYEKISKYLAPPGKEAENNIRKWRSSSGSSCEIIPNINKGQQTEKEEQQKKKSIRNKKKLKSTSPQMNVIRGYWDKNLKKFIRVESVYRFPPHEDPKFERNGEMGRKITLNQYLRECKIRKERQKKHLDSLKPSCSRHNLNDNGSTTNFQLEQSVVKTKRKSYCESFRSEAKKPKIVMVDASDSELNRINEIRRFASSLNAKRRRIISSESSDESTEVHDEYEFATTSQKESRKFQKNKASKSMSNVAKIKAIEPLVTLRCKKYKDHWRITDIRKKTSK